MATNSEIKKFLQEVRKEQDNRLATQSSAGFMSAADKFKLDSFQFDFDNGYEPLDCGIYASLSWLDDFIDWRGLGCAVWSAQWGSHDDFKGYMWQFTDKLLIGGKKFDGNILYK